jgi:hypothetical protein
VRRWPLPRTLTELRAFLGKVGYYRRFIKDYGKIAAPLTDAKKEENLLEGGKGGKRQVPHPDNPGGPISPRHTPGRSVQSAYPRVPSVRHGVDVHRGHRLVAGKPGHWRRPVAATRRGRARHRLRGKEAKRSPGQLSSEEGGVVRGGLLSSAIGTITSGLSPLSCGQTIAPSYGSRRWTHRQE